MKANAKRIWEYLQKVHGKDVTAADVAEALEISKRSVDGTFTMTLQQNNFGYREASEIELPDGTHKPVKFLRLTDEGLAKDLSKEEITG